MIYNHLFIYFITINFIELKFQTFNIKKKSKNNFYKYEIFFFFYLIYKYQLLCNKKPSFFLKDLREGRRFAKS
jgi:hypothetical protein